MRKSCPRTHKFCFETVTCSTRKKISKFWNTKEKPLSRRTCLLLVKNRRRELCKNEEENILFQEGLVVLDKSWTPGQRLDRLEQAQNSNTLTKFASFGSKANTFQFVLLNSAWFDLDEIKKPNKSNKKNFTIQTPAL